jgi:hypothetical protein
MRLQMRPLDVAVRDRPAVHREPAAVAATFESNGPASFLVRKMPAFLAAVRDRWRDYDGTYIGLID